MVHNLALEAHLVRAYFKHGYLMTKFFIGKVFWDKRCEQQVFLEVKFAEFLSPVV